MSRSAIVELRDRKSLGKRSSERRLLDPVELAVDLGLDARDVLGVDSEVVTQDLRSDGQRVARTPPLELPLGAILARVATRVPNEAIGAGLYKLGAGARADARGDLHGSLSHGPDVHAVDLRCRQVHRGGARQDPTGRDGFERRVFAVAVVLTHEDDWKREHLCEVQAFEEVRLVRRAVAEV